MKRKRNGKDSFFHKANKVAALKEKKKEIESEIKSLEKEIIPAFPKEEIETDYGILKLEHRTEYSVPDNGVLLKSSSITKDNFISKAKMSATTIKGIVSESEFSDLIEKEVVVVKNISEYLKLHKPKTNGK